MHVIERVVARWREDGLDVNPAAPQERLRSLELRLGMPLPADVRLYFSLANGFSDGTCDSRHVAFWSIERILADSDEVAVQPGDLGLADVLINSWFVSLRKRRDGGVRIFVENPSIELPSLTEFFDRYESAPDSLDL